MSTNKALWDQLEAVRNTLERARDHLNTDRCDDPPSCDICSNWDDSGPAEAAVAYLDEYALEVVCKLGTPLAVVFTTGGPHIEIRRDIRNGPATLVGHWGSDRDEIHNPVFDWAVEFYLPDDDGAR